jgi:hypothetical protein
MSALFSSPKSPKAPDPPAPPPTNDAAAVLDAEQAARQRAGQAKGRSSTVLTATSDRPSPVGGKSLLGGP